MKALIQFLCCTLLMGAQIQAQNWTPVGSGGGRKPYFARCIYADTAENQLIIGGGMNEDYFSFLYDKIRTWDGNDWTQLGLKSYDPGPARELIRYKGDLYVSGNMVKIDTLAAEFARWDGQAWHIIPGAPEGSGFAFYESGGLFYVGGVLEKWDSIDLPGILTWDGQNWEHIGEGFLSEPHFNNPARTASIIRYRGHLIAGGNAFLDPQGGDLALKYLDGNYWRKIPGWMNGGPTYVGAMLEYKGELYVAGGFYKKTGSLGNSIVKWDGSNWYELGDGIQGNIYDMVIYRDELWVAGGFFLVDSMAPPGSATFMSLAKWDGQRWCTLPGSQFDHMVEELAVWNDSLYVVGPFVTVSGDTVHHVARWVGGNQVDQCGAVHYLPLALDPDPQAFSLRLYPNPATNAVSVDWETDGVQTAVLRVFNILGREEFVVRDALPGQVLDLRKLRPGLYLLVAEGEDWEKKQKLLIH